MKRLQILLLWLALALSAYAQPTAGGTYQLTLAKINAAIGSGTLAVAKIGGGTPGAGKYVDGGTGNWTTLPTATTDASLLTSGTLPLARLVNITTTEISASAGIVAGQIASIPNQAASIITSGTMATARLGSGSATASTFLHGDSTWAALVAADIPAHNASAANLTSGAIASAARLSTSGTADTTTFLRGDLTWATPAGGSSNISLSNITSGTLASSVPLNMGSNAIVFNGTGSVPASTVSYIVGDANNGNIIANVPTALSMRIRKAGTTIAEFGGYSDTSGDGRWAIGQVDNSYARLISDGAYLYANCPTGYALKLLYQGTEKYRFAAALAEMDRISLGATIGSSTDPGAGYLGAKGVQFTGAGAFDTSKAQIYADAAAGDIVYEVPTGKYHDWIVGSDLMLILGFANNAQGDQKFSLGKYSTGTTNGAYAGIASTAATALDLNVNTGGSITQRINNATVVNVTSTGAAVSGKFYVSTTQTPASASASGTTGQICWDASYLYVCVNTNTWTRVAIATW